MSNPLVQPNALKDDWDDNPNLTLEQIEYLRSVPVEKLEEALDQAFEQDDDRYLAIFDEIRMYATNLLLSMGNMTGGESL